MIQPPSGPITHASRVPASRPPRFPKPFRRRRARGEHVGSPWRRRSIDMFGRQSKGGILVWKPAGTSIWKAGYELSMRGGVCYLLKIKTSNKTPGTRKNHEFRVGLGGMSWSMVSIVGTTGVARDRAWW